MSHCSAFRRKHKDHFDEALVEAVDVLQGTDDVALIVVDMDEVAGIVPATVTASDSSSCTDDASVTYSTNRSVTVGAGLTWSVSENEGRSVGFGTGSGQDKASGEHVTDSTTLTGNDGRVLRNLL